MVKVREDLTGKKFGRLTVIKQVEDYINPHGTHYAQWLCECECSDKQIIVRGTDLKNGHTKSCGCIHREKMAKNLIDLTGKQFGRLTVKERAKDYIDKNGKHIAQWLCECSCEEHKCVIARGSDLRSGATRSCGCLNQERIKKYNKYSEKLIDEHGEYYIGYCSNTNSEFYIDAEDYDTIKDYCWLELIHKRYHYLAAWNIGSTGNILMMHLIVGKNYDHADRNPLNNRRYNLRPCNICQNAMNSSIRINNTSGVTGVNWDKQSQKWIARIQCYGNRITLGHFENKEDAIKARLEGEAKYHKDFAPQNKLFSQYNIEEERYGNRNKTEDC